MNDTMKRKGKRVAADVIVIVALSCLVLGCDEERPTMKYEIDVREGPPPLEEQRPYPFAFDDAFREKVMGLVEYASKLQHYYHPDKSKRRPVDNPNHRIVWGDYLIVYSITARDGRRWRRMTISINGGRYPHPLTACTVAHWFGFTGAKEDENGLVHDVAPTWLARRNPADYSIIIIEEMSG